LLNFYNIKTKNKKNNIDKIERKKMNKEQEINDLYEEVLREYESMPRNTTVYKTRQNFAMDVHEKMKQEQIKKIMSELGDVVNRITSSNGDKTKLYERFNDLIKKFEEENNYEYSYGGKKNDKKNDKKKSKKKRVTTAYKKKKRTMRKNKIKSKFKTAY